MSKMVLSCIDGLMQEFIVSSVLQWAYSVHFVFIIFYCAFD